MPALKNMKEYVLQIHFVVDARDEEEAIEIAKAARRAVQGIEYKVRDVETYKIEEL
jgi:hypothetical protein